MLRATISRMITRVRRQFVAFRRNWFAQTNQRADALPSRPSRRRSASGGAGLDLDLDQVEQTQAIEVLRKAVKIDPNFAMGHELLSQTSLDPAEQVASSQRAFACRITPVPPRD